VSTKVSEDTKKKAGELGETIPKKQGKRRRTEQAQISDFLRGRKGGFTNPRPRRRFLVGQDVSFRFRPEFPDYQAAQSLWEVFVPKNWLAWVDCEAGSRVSTGSEGSFKGGTGQQKSAGLAAVGLNKGTKPSSFEQNQNQWLKFALPFMPKFTPPPA